MLKCLQSQGHLYALDVDPIESAKTKERLEKLGYGEDILTIRLQSFADIDLVARDAGKFDFVLADLGVSSMQIDNPDRGFSYKTEGPLDLRMNPQKGISAAQRLKSISREELQENSDEPYAKEISQEEVSRLKKGGHIETTGELRQTIEDALSFLPDSRRESKSGNRSDIIIECKTAGRTENIPEIVIKPEHQTSSEGRLVLEKTKDVLRTEPVYMLQNGENRSRRKAGRRRIGAKQGNYLFIADANVNEGSRLKAADILHFSLRNNITRVLVDVPEATLLCENFEEYGFRKAYSCTCYKKQ